LFLAEAVLTFNGVLEVPVGSVEYLADPSLSLLSMLPCHSSSGRNDVNASEEQIFVPARTIQIPVSY